MCNVVHDVSIPRRYAKNDNVTDLDEAHYELFQSLVGTLKTDNGIIASGPASASFNPS